MNHLKGGFDTTGGKTVSELADAGTGVAPLRVFEPGFLSLSLRPGELTTLDLHWITGSENAPGSWKLKTEELSSQQPRKFDLDGVRIEAE